MKRSLDDFELSTDDITTTFMDDENTIIKLITKILIIFLIFAGCAVLVVVIIGLIFVYINCRRPTRIHKQIPIEYLSSKDMINYLDDKSMSEGSVMEKI